MNLAGVWPNFKKLIYIVLDVILLKNADLEESAEQGLMERVSIFYETSLFR